MLRALLISAIITGFLSGLALTLAQRFEVIPILLKAESYETIGREKIRVNKAALESAEHNHAHSAWTPEDGVERFLWTALANISLGIGFALLLCAIYAWRYGSPSKGEIRLRETIGREKIRVNKAALESAEHNHAHSAWTPEDGVERFLWTALANISLGIGFALLLCAIYAWRYGSPSKGEIRLREGVLWGMGGLIVFFINPALGMPPEVPGGDTVAVDIRQGWWLLAVICTALGLGLIVFQRQTIGALTGVVFCLLPHVIGAPHAEANDRVPAELKGAFLGATYLANAIFWVALGLISAWSFRCFTSRPGD